MDACATCGDIDFEENAGHYFCISCGTQSQKQNIHIEVTGKEDVKIIEQEKNDKSKKELTTWEEFNCVLVGLVEEMISLGANDRFKITTLQIWAEFLRKNEVAFFETKVTALPKLGACFKPRDANVLYNKTYNYKRKKSSTNLKSATQRKHKKKDIIQAEYDKLSQSSSSKSSMSSKSNTSCPINFSRSARGILKKRMPKNHIKVHEIASDNLACHRFRRIDVPAKVNQTVLGRNILFAIIYLSLNWTEDEIQLSDLLRFAREGHLSYHTVDRFFPENYDTRKIKRIYTGSPQMFLHDRMLRLHIEKVRKIVGIHSLNKPNLFDLCKRFVKELCLPNIIYQYTESLIAYCPPEFKTPLLLLNIPSFDGRAMAYIIFILKLIFGLDGNAENMLSKSAEEVNQRMNCDYVFIWSEWVKFIEMRKIILKNHHFPTLLAVDPNSERHTHLYLDFLKNLKIKHDINEESMHKRPKNDSNLIYIKDTFQKIQQIHTEKFTENSLILKFKPSMTPNLDYIKYILDNYQSNHKIDVPDFMNVKHNERNIECFLKPNKFQNFLKDSNCSIKLNIIPIQCNQDTNMKFTKYFKNEYHQKVMYMQRISLKTVSSEEYVQPYNGVSETEEESDCEGGKRDPPLKLNKSNSDEYVGIDQNNVKQRCDLESSEILFDDQSEDDSEGEDIESDQDVQPIIFNTPTFKYWTKMGILRDVGPDEFTKIEGELPKSFVWLLHECARIVEMKPRDLYFEVLQIENQFLYALEPMNKIRNRVLYRNPKKIITPANMCFHHLFNQW